MNRLLRYLTALFISLSLVSCGGGGGGGGGTGSSGDTSYSISLDKSSVSFIGTFGRMPTTPQVVTATFKGDGVVVGIPTGGFEPSWLRIVSTGSANGSATFAVSVKETTTPLPPGSYVARVRFVTGSTSSGTTVYRDLPISMMVMGPSPTQPQVLFADRQGVAFTSLPELSHLSQVVTLKTNASSLGTLTAVSNADWLAAGVSGNQVTLTADPGDLANGLHYANVSVNSDVVGMSSETIRVGLFVGSTAPSDGSTLPVTATNPYNVVVDPIRPWLYEATAGGIKAINIYTGATDFTNTTLGVSPGNLMTSADGRWVFARSGAGNYHRLDMNSNTWTSFSIPKDTDSTSTQYLRLTGRDLLLTDKGIVFDPLTGAYVSQNQFQSSIGELLFAISGDFQRIATVDKGLSGTLRPIIHQATFYPADDIFRVTILGNGYDSISFAKDIAMNHDGSRLALAGGRLLRYSYDSVDGMQFQSGLNQISPPENVLFTRNNALYSSNGQFVSYHSPEGEGGLSIRPAYAASGFRGLQTSSDGLMLIVITRFTSNNAVAFRTVN